MEFQVQLTQTDILVIQEALVAASRASLLKDREVLRYQDASFRRVCLANSKRHREHISHALDAFTDRLPN